MWGLVPGTWLVVHIYIKDCGRLSLQQPPNFHASSEQGLEACGGSISLVNVLRSEESI